MADETVSLDWGEHPTNRRPTLVAPECGIVKKVEFSPHGEKQILVRLVTEVGQFEFGMFRRHISSFTQGMHDLEQRMGSEDK
jgi:hypothetical protein